MEAKEEEVETEHVSENLSTHDEQNAETKAIVSEGEVAVTGYKTWYKIVGPLNESSKLIVCVHGIGGHSYVWQHLAKSLSDNGNYVVVYFDLSGRGGSEISHDNQTADFFTKQIYDVIFNLLLNTKYPKFTLIGHSMGGAICVHFASKYPDMVEKLVLIAPAGAHFKFPTGSSLIKLPGLGSALFKMSQDENKIQAQGFYNLEKSKEIIEWNIKEGKSKFNMDTFTKAFLSSFKHFPLNGLSKEIEIVGSHSRPALIIWGEFDESVPFKDCFPVYEKQFKTAHCAVIKETRHIPFLEKIDLVNGIILDFLEGKFTKKETVEYK